MIPKKIHLFTDQRKQDAFEAAPEYTGREDLTPEKLAPVFSSLEWIRSNKAQDPARKTTELRACPFCGNASFSEYEAQGVHIKESERKATGYNNLTENTTSTAAARQRAINK